MMKKAAYLTLGCRVNQYETQAIREELERYGFSEGLFEEPCDLYLINTCAVTAESVRKDKKAIRRALRMREDNPAAVVCVCGCFSQGEPFDELLMQADVVAGNAGKSRLASFLAEYCKIPVEERKRASLVEDVDKVHLYEPLSVCRSHNARAFVKIQDGCNSFCSYCYVPLVRGRVRSRSVEDICQEVQTLADASYREIVLTGIETGSFGEDRCEKNALPSLVERLSRISGIERIRFGSLKPILFDEKFCRALSSFEKVMPHFHLSLQSGSSAVLKTMRRRYGREEALAAIERIYRFFPDAGISADLICGFPGESEADFEESVSLVKSAGLLHTHIFPFSPREGTKAFSLPDPICEEEKRRRCALLLEAAKTSSEAFHLKRVGKKYRVLCERIQNGMAYGYTENFIYTQTPLEGKIDVGEIFPVILEKECSFRVETMTVSAKNVKEVDNFEKKL